MTKVRSMGVLGVVGRARGLTSGNTGGFIFKERYTKHLGGNSFSKPKMDEANLGRDEHLLRLGDGPRE